MKIQKIRPDYSGFELAEVNEATAVEVLEFLFNQKSWRQHPDGLEIIDRKIRQCYPRLFAENPVEPSAPLDHVTPRWEQVQALRAADAAWTIPALAMKFGVSESSIRNDLNRRAVVEVAG